MAALGAPPPTVTRVNGDFTPNRAALTAEEQGNNAEAALLWAQAYELDPSPATLLAMARAQSKTPEHCHTARNSYARFLLACPGCAQRTSAQREARNLDAACTVRLHIGALKHMTIEGQPAAGPTVLLSPGAHRLQGPVHGRTLCLQPGSDRVWTAPKSSTKKKPTTPEAQALAFEYEAFEHLGTEDWCEAIHTLELAHRTVPNPGYLFNIAQAYERWPKHCAAATRGFRAYIKACPKCAQTQVAEQRRDLLLASCGARVEIEGQTLTTEVSIDDAPYDSGQLFAPGAHILTVDYDGRVIRRPFYLQESGHRTFNLSAPELAQVEPPSRLAAQVVATPSPPMATGSSMGPKVLAVLSATTLVTSLIGGGFALDARADLDRVEDAAQLMPSNDLALEANALASRGRSARAVLWGGLGVALTAGTTALVWWIFDGEATP